MVNMVKIESDRVESTHYCVINTPTAQLKVAINARLMVKKTLSLRPYPTIVPVHRSVAHFSESLLRAVTVYLGSIYR